MTTPGVGLKEFQVYVAVTVRDVMWTLFTELLFSFVVLAFLVLSCQSVLHIASGTVRSVLTYIHAQLDRELGEDESMPDQEENVTTRVVRRRVILKVSKNVCRGNIGAIIVQGELVVYSKKIYQLRANSE